jgi:hypothetical protein
MKRRNVDEGSNAWISSPTVLRAADIEFGEPVVMAVMLNVKLHEVANI